MSPNSTDRNLLFGILALQLDFIDKERLVAGMNAWVLTKTKPIGQIFLEQAALSPERYTLLEAIVQEHLKLHDNDPEKSLASINTLRSIHEDLSIIADLALHASLSWVPVARQVEDYYQTQMPSASGPSLGQPLAPSVGAPSSLGLRFQILRPHAKGGLGEVLVAHDQELHREVALKRMQERNADDPDSRSRFLLEAEITGGLEHPGIVPVYGLGTYEDGRPYYAMRFIRGDSLKDALARFHSAEGPSQSSGARALELRQFLGRFIAVCNAIAYAHARGVVHRDIKPANIMLGKYGETLVVDWGLAKPLDRVDPTVEAAEGTLTPTFANISMSTQMGSTIGTPQYMSPEQAEGRLDLLGTASDVYSLGATLYSLLTGKSPFEGSDIGAILRKVQLGQFSRPSKVDPSVPLPLDAICLKAMALEPESRYASPRDLADDIEHWLADEPVAAWREPWRIKARRWISRHRTLVTGAASATLVAVVVLALATVLLTAANRATKEQREKAEGNYQLARQAVDRYHTNVSENLLLHEPGLQPLRKKLLEDAREFYEDFVREREHSPDVKGELGKSLFRLAQITGEIDSPDKAIALHQQAHDHFAKLVADHPEDPEYKGDLAACDHELGRLYRLTDQLEQAETFCQKAITGWEELRQEYPKEARYRAGLARSQNVLANVYQVSGLLDQAEVADTEALKRWEDLCDVDGANTTYQRYLALSHNHLGMVFNDRGETKKAEQTLGKSLTLRKKLADSNPRISQYQDDLARTLYNLGDLFSQSGQTRRAESPFVEAASIWKDLTDKHPSMTQFQTNLAEAYSALISVYRSAGNTAKAEKVSRQAHDIKKQLAGIDPKTPTYQSGLAAGYSSLGDVHRDSREYTKAEGAYQDALRIQEKLVGDHSGIPQYRADVARSYNNLGLTYQVGKKGNQAEEAFQKALSHWEELAKTYPKGVEFALGLSQTCYNLGNLRIDDNKPGPALDWYARSISTLEKRFGPKDLSVAMRRILSNTHRERADALTQLGRYPEAEVAYQDALGVQELLAGNHPGIPQYRADVARSYHNLGLTYQVGKKGNQAEEAFQKALSHWEELAKTYPKEEEFALGLSKTCYALGNLRIDDNKPGPALDWYARSISTLEKRAGPKDLSAPMRRILSNTYKERADALTRLGRYTEAIEAWDRAIVFASASNQSWFTLYRTTTLARSGDHVQATAKALEATPKATRNGEMCYLLAGVYSLSASAAAKDARLPADERRTVADRYAALAVELLEKARKANFFESTTNIDRLSKDPDLGFLRENARLEALLSDLRAKVKP